MALYKTGSTGDEVKSLQTQLNTAGYNLATDGIYGNQTQAAVRDYQTKNGLTIDGIAGNQTLSKLSSGGVPTTTAVATPKPITPIQPVANTPAAAGTTASTAGLTGLRDYGVGKGLDIGWNATDGVTVNGGKIDTSGLTLSNGKYYGNVDQLNNLFSPYATKPEAQKGVYDDRINTALEGITNYKNTPYDVTTDPQYNSMRNQYDLAGQTAFNNQIGRLAALTGGRASTAAIGTAAAAQNQYANQFTGQVLPSLISAEETRRQSELANMYNQLDTLQGLDNTDYNRMQDTKEEYANTVGRFHENNYQAEINKVQNDNDPSNDYSDCLFGASKTSKAARHGTAESSRSSSIR